MPAVHSLLLHFDDVVMVTGSDEESSSDVELVGDCTPGHGHQEEYFHFIMELYSPFRVAASIHRLGMRSAASLDVLTGCDLLSAEGRMEALALLTQKRPLFLMCSPPCTMYSELTRMWNAKKMTYEQRALRQREADSMLKFAMEMCRLQGQAGRFWCHEHPHKASSWKHDIAALFCNSAHFLSSHGLGLEGHATIINGRCVVGSCEKQDRKNTPPESHHNKHCFNHWCGNQKPCGNS